jgi:allantoate deiminase
LTHSGRAARIEVSPGSGTAPAARILERLEALFEIDRRAGANRPGLSSAEERAFAMAEEWMRDAALEVRRDAVGNVIGRLPGARPDLPEVWSGSHLDTVPDGGRFDGALGVVAAIEAAAALARGTRPRRTVAAVAFRLEEGWRFGRGLFGSRALCGALADDELELRDATGTTLGDALAALGLEAPPRGRPLTPVPRWFVETHVEQGPLLAAAGVPVGVVRSIAGMAGLSVRFDGRRGHAGTTPMGLRADALAPAARFVLAVHAAARAIPDAVATVGQLHVDPGATNVIPHRVTLFADLRAPDAQRLEQLVTAARAAVRTEGGDVEQRWYLEPVAMAAAPSDAIARAIAGAGYQALPIVSGAGHDAGVLQAAGVPSAMLFVRSLAGGVSHAPEEATDEEAIAVSAAVLQDALRALAG